MGTSLCGLLLGFDCAFIGTISVHARVATLNSELEMRTPFLSSFRLYRVNH